MINGIKCVYKTDCSLCGQEKHTCHHEQQSHVIHGHSEKQETFAFATDIQRMLRELLQTAGSKQVSVATSQHTFIKVVIDTILPVYLLMLAFW